MAPTDEMFRFVSTRPAETVLQHRIESRLIRDRRRRAPLLGVLYGPGEFGPKLREADEFAASADFVTSEDPLARALEPVVAFFRRELRPGRELDELGAAFVTEFPLLAGLLALAPPANLLEQTAVTLARLWDSLYAQVIRGCDRFVSTNHLIDGLRVYRVILLLWYSGTLKIERWQGGTFDEYEAIVDLQAAAAGGVLGTLEPGEKRELTLATSKDVTPASAAARAPQGVFHTPLTVGAIRPPVVGELNLVEQELREYVLGEIAEIQTIMRGERRESSTRALSRTTQTTTTETLTEQEESSSVTVEERFLLASQAQETAAQSFGVQVGVSVSGKFGPVQIGATANASYDTSESSTQSTSQEFARTVTEEATKRVKTSIKETSSITLLTETQTTTLQAFDNTGGEGHVNGIYRFVDAMYDARLMSYGRRLMWTAAVPEPAALYRGLLQQVKGRLRSDLVEPVHPAMIDRETYEPLPPTGLDDGVRSYEDITEENYARLAALYDVTNVVDPPQQRLTGGKPFVVPTAMQPIEMKDDGLSLVMSDAGLMPEAGYRLVTVGVFAPDGDAPADERGTFRPYADAMHLGEKKEETDRILVQIGHKDFRFEVTGQGNNDPKLIDTNFNLMFPLIEKEGGMYDELVRPSMPITVSASFSGMLAFNVVWTAVRTDEALSQWKSATYAAILKGYTGKKQAYDQAVALVQAQVETETLDRTFALRTDQYRAIELTELKRGCLELLTEGTATGRTSISVSDDGTPTIVHHEADATGLTDWRSPLANGTVADYFETSLDWQQATYEFHPYYWAGAERWAETAQATSADPVFEGFLRAGSASVVVPVRPGYERPFLFFLKTGLLWGGRYLPLFTSPEMLAVYADVELATQLDPPVQIGETWPVKVPTSLVMLQEEQTLPQFPPTEPEVASEVEREPVPGEDAPF